MSQPLRSLPGRIALALALATASVAWAEPDVEARHVARAHAQLEQRVAHPYFWSPFLVIGNWL